MDKIVKWLQLQAVAKSRILSTLHPFTALATHFCREIFVILLHFLQQQDFRIRIPSSIQITQPPHPVFVPPYSSLIFSGYQVPPSNPSVFWPLAKPVLFFGSQNFCTLVFALSPLFCIAQSVPPSCLACFFFMDDSLCCLFLPLCLTIVMDL